MRRLLVCVSLAALVVGGCQVKTQGNGGGGSGGAGNGGSTAPAVQLDINKLQAAVSDPASKRFYEARGWAAAWDDKQAKALEAAIADAPRHAINPASFLKDARAGASPEEREANRTKAALNYAHALAFGMVQPDKLFDVYTVPKPRIDLNAGLSEALQAGAVPKWLASLAPSDPEYQALSAEYLRYMARAPHDHPTPIAPGGKIDPGHKDSRIPQIVAALRTGGYLPAAPAGQASAQQPAQSAAASTAYGGEIAGAVRKLQADYGIKPDGVIGVSTIEALNNGAAERARILAVNLERRRWLDRAPPQTRIDVNTAATFLRYWRDGQLAHQARVVVGQPGWETPELGSPITRLVANPDWTVPESIEQKELRPKGAAYLKAQHIVEKNGRLVQEPGPTNSLGQVKFDMLNDQSIYLHDTPAKALFASEERHSSHGCIRVQDAIGFARLIANDQGLLDPFNKALATGKEGDVSLKTRIPVRLMYHSAYLDGGRIVFRPDPYGLDDKLAAALGLGNGAIRHHVVKKVDDIGP
ncbi:MAG: murein L,D-transpeptidase [Alphaproteobacteria bacterium]|nr:murein L,D-transpeptidase [Alphaproteobacteria bacterium]MDB5723011.1 murein L,D-transpeptidase [Alphaproteobacteria bacterium]